MFRKSKAALVALGIILSLLASPARAAETDCSVKKDLSLDYVRGIVRVCQAVDGQVIVGIEGVSAPIPIPEYGTVASYAMSAETGHFEISLGVDESGLLGLSIDGVQYGSPLSQTVAPAQIEAAATVAGATYPGCSNGYGALFPYKWTKAWVWNYNLSGQPDSQSLPAIQEAANLWTTGANRCTAQIYHSTFTNTFAGGSSKLPSPTANNSCGSADGYNIVGWGALMSGQLALTCTYFPNGTIAVEADIKFSTALPFYTGASVTGCVAKYDLREIAAHEVGHVVGLDHTPDMYSQLMKYTFGQCETGERLLAPGDLSALLSRY